MEKERRYKVYITCKICGERFVLRGTESGKGHHGTGFKQCICNNDNLFLVRTEEA